MRFAYIDSQGNEVEIPSEDALRLRIELGAIVADTQLYDGVSDRWARAGDHDFFRRMRKELDGDGPGLPASGASAGSFEVLDTSPWSGMGPDETVLPPAPPAARASAGPPAPSPAAPPPSRRTAESPPFDGAWDEQPGTPAPEPAPASPSPFGDAGSTVPPDGMDAKELTDEVIDFSDFGVLELDDETPVAPRSTAPPPENPTLEWEPSPPDAPSPADDPWTMPGREPWPPPAESLAASSRAAGTAAHPFDAEEATPEWLRNDPDFAEPEPSVPAGPTDRSHEVGAGPATAAPASIRRAPPKRARSRNIPYGRIAVGLVVVGLVAGGAFWGLNREGGAAEPEVVEVVLPPIAPSLQPVLRSVSAVTIDDWMARIRALPFGESLPVGPDEAWLGGRYMASAGEFADVRLYWESLGRYTQIVQAREAELFDEALLAAIDTVPLPDADRTAVLERVRAGFAAAGPDREAVYHQLRAVIEASLTLHSFLEENEANIDFEPADAGLSRDPVLEAVPITDALGDEMWNRVAGITSALDAVGYLDKVTTDGLLTVVLDKLEAVPLR